jgi:hypothetical protein
MLDISVLSFLFIFFLASYFSLEETDKEDILERISIRTRDFIDSRGSIFLMILFILFFYLAVYFSRIPMTADTKPYFIVFIENTSWILLILCIFVNFFSMIFKFSMIDSIFSFFDWTYLPNDPPVMNNRKKEGFSIEEMDPSSFFDTIKRLLVPSNFISTTAPPTTTVEPELTLPPTHESEILKSLTRAGPFPKQQGLVSDVQDMEIYDVNAPETKCLSRLQATTYQQSNGDVSDKNPYNKFGMIYLDVPSSSFDKNERKVTAKKALLKSQSETENIKVNYYNGGEWSEKTA